MLLYVGDPGGGHFRRLRGFIYLLFYYFGFDTMLYMNVKDAVLDCEQKEEKALEDKVNNYVCR